VNAVVSSNKENSATNVEYEGRAKGVLHSPNSNDKEEG
jgi:hypothetical protein